MPDGPQEPRYRITPKGRMFVEFDRLHRHGDFSLESVGKVLEKFETALERQGRIDGLREAADDASKMLSARCQSLARSWECRADALEQEAG